MARPMTRDELLTLILARVRRCQRRAWRETDLIEAVALTREARALLETAKLIGGRSWLES